MSRNDTEEILYDEPTVLEALVALRRCEPTRRLDSLAVVVKAFVECDWSEYPGVSDG